MTNTSHREIDRVVPEITTPLQLQPQSRICKHCGHRIGWRHQLIAAVEGLYHVRCWRDLIDGNA